MGFSVDQLVDWVGGRIANRDAVEGRLSQIDIKGTATLTEAGSGDVAFFFDPNYRSELPRAKPGVLVTGEAFVGPLSESGLPIWNETAIVVSSDPYGAMAIIADKLAPEILETAHFKLPSKTEIHPTAVVDPSVRLGKNVRVGAHAVIEHDAQIGDHSVIYPNAFIGPDVVIGKETVIFSGVSIYEHSRIGNQVRIHSACVIGADGFGYAPEIKNGKPVAHRKIHHVGRVMIGNRVEVGAGSTIDRGTLGDTVIEDDVKIDNQVQVGHNCKVRRGAVLCGQVGLAGSAVVEDFAYVGGQTGVSNKITIGAGAKVGGCAVVTSNVPAGEVAWGYPARLGRKTHRLEVLLERLLKNPSLVMKREKKS